MTDTERQLMKDVFSKLTETQREFIMNAFDKLEPEILEYEPGKFLGCHCKELSAYDIQAQNDFWFVGVSKI